MWAADCINTPDEKQQQEHGNVPFQIQEYPGYCRHKLFLYMCFHTFPEMNKIEQV